MFVLERFVNIYFTYNTNIIRADFLFVRLFVCLSVRLSFCPSIHLSVHTFVRLSVCPSFCLSICPFVHLCLLVCRSVGLSVCLSVCPLFHLSICLSIRLSVRLSTYLTITQDNMHSDIRCLGLRNTTRGISRMYASVDDAK
jgi:hypothetical protein